ncbi:sodium-dependent glucose transporter 1-like [Saccostrea echinata]|uniref:sodium-dependent glucose transporter 1-like n=1 Tax=Saccostrea echinata TaxID=191078 RepID=UPI002A80FC7A|nr:sodium-dependent glucose transporter 1-like [Saccostrea echinata]
MSKQTEECSGSRRDGGNFWFKMKKDQLFRSKFILKLAYIASFLTLGWREGQFGPTFPDLLNITNTTLERGSLFFTMNSVGYLLGSMLIGFLFDKRLLDRNLLMFLIIAGYGTIFVIIPWCGIYEVMVTVFIVKGSFAGGLDTCGNAGLVTTWGSEGGAYFSALHFALAAGAILSPLVTAPYVMSPSDDVPMRTFTNNVNSTNITDTLIDINRKRFFFVIDFPDNCYVDGIEISSGVYISRKIASSHPIITDQELTVLSGT